MSDFNQKLATIRVAEQDKLEDRYVAQCRHTLTLVADDLEMLAESVDDLNACLRMKLQAMLIRNMTLV